MDNSILTMLIRRGLRSPSLANIWAALAMRGEELVILSVLLPAMSSSRSAIIQRQERIHSASHVITIGAPFPPLMPYLLAQTGVQRMTAILILSQEVPSLPNVTMGRYCNSPCMAVSGQATVMLT